MRKILFIVPDEDNKKPTALTETVVGYVLNEDPNNPIDWIIHKFDLNDYRTFYTEEFYKLLDRDIDMIIFGYIPDFYESVIPLKIMMEKNMIPITPIVIPRLRTGCDMVIGFRIFKDITTLDYDMISFDTLSEIYRKNNDIKD